jgi:hypothetical protein
MNTDQVTKMKVLTSIDPAVIYNSNGTKTGSTIDTAGYESLTFVFQTGVLTDGTWATQVFGGNASNMSDEAQLTGNNLINADLSEAITDDSVCKRQGVNVAAAGFRYYRMKATQAAATTGGYVAGLAILSNPRVMPVATP